MREFNQPDKLLKKSNFTLHHSHRPLDLEIGCGVGLHPIQYCQRNPERNLIAIEHTKMRFFKFQRRAHKHRLPNLFPIHANALSWIPSHLSDQQVERVFLLYPNPWPKPKHQHRRWHSMPFMQELLRVLIDEGEILLATNRHDYIEEARQTMPTLWGLQELSYQKIDGPFRTHFEKKYLERGETCYQAIFQKRKHPQEIKARTHQ